jgi:putative ABC transport system substrate-binding protein
MRRREFITLLGGAAASSSASWPLVAHAQQPKRVGLLMNEVGQANLVTFRQGLRKLGWIEGQNLQIEVRWSAGDPTRIETYATDLVGLFKPDVLLAHTTGNLVALTPRLICEGCSVFRPYGLRHKKKSPEEIPGLRHFG